MLVKPLALAYVNWGRWVADCPAACGSAIVLASGQSTFHCPECKHLSGVYWPHNPDEIMEVLEVRNKRNQNWFPVNHDLALRFGLPHGQSVSELREETEAHRGME